MEETPEKINIYLAVKFSKMLIRTIRRTTSRNLINLIEGVRTYGFMSHTTGETEELTKRCYHT
jgi:hypothetical protein